MPYYGNTIIALEAKFTITKSHNPQCELLSEASKKKECTNINSTCMVHVTVVALRYFMVVLRYFMVASTALVVSCMHADSL